MKVYQAVLDQLIGAGVTYFSGMIGSTAAPYAAAGMPAAVGFLPTARRSASLSRSKKLYRFRLLWVLGRSTAGETKPNGPKGGPWV